MRVQSQRIFRMPRLERKQTPARLRDLLINPMTELHPDLWLQGCLGPVQCTRSPTQLLFWNGCLHSLDKRLLSRNGFPRSGNKMEMRLRLRYLAMRRAGEEQSRLS